MSVKKDPSGRRWYEIETVLPGTVEQVWQAIATGPGVSSWFAKCEVDEREGGEVRGDMGMGLQKWGTVKTWRPPYQFVTEGKPIGEDGPTFAAEWTIEALSGNTCRLRMVQSLFADSDEWDGELENIERGWGKFEGLRLYLEHFAGLSCTIVPVLQPTTGTVEDVWRALGDALQFHDSAPGRRWQVPDGAAPSLAGVFDVLHGGTHPKAVLHIDRPAPGIAMLCVVQNMGMTLVCGILYLYGEGAASIAEREDPLWRTWFADRFPPPAMEIQP